MSGIPKPFDQQVIPAEPSWAVVVPVWDQTGHSIALFRIPVIAWLVDLYRRSTDETTFVGVTPLTVQGDISDVQDYALQHGDRPPFYTAHEDFDDEGALSAYFIRSRRVSGP
jgi:hypothetical protein